MGDVPFRKDAIDNANTGIVTGKSSDTESLIRSPAFHGGQDNISPPRLSARSLAHRRQWRQKDDHFDSKLKNLDA